MATIVCFSIIRWLIWTQTLFRCDKCDTWIVVEHVFSYVEWGVECDNASFLDTFRGVEHILANKLFLSLCVLVSLCLVSFYLQKELLSTAFQTKTINNILVNKLNIIIKIWNIDKKETDNRMSESNRRRLFELLKLEGNHDCADCHEDGPEWASYTIGVFLCTQCARFVWTSWLNITLLNFCCSWQHSP